jgi:MFS family permease
MAFMLMIGGEFLHLPHETLVPLLFLGIFISGVARSFMMPAHFSITPQIIDRKDYSAANAWANTGFQISAICGPILAGLVYGFYGVTSAWILPISFMTLGFCCVISFKNLRQYEKFEQIGSAFKNIIDGWKFIIQNRMLLTVMIVDMVAVLFGGAVALLPAFADEILEVGPEGLGLLRTAPGIGAIFTALYFALRPMTIFPLTRMLWAVSGFGVCIIGFGLSTSFYLSIFFLALSGLFDTISVIIRVTLKQLLTPDNMRGRVSAISSMFIISSNEIGAFESGVVAKLMGLAPSVVFGGLMSLIVAGTTYIVTPNLRKTIIKE